MNSFDEASELERKLMNRFNILVFLEDLGIEWAKIAIDPDDDRYWTPEDYLDCYNNPEA